MKIISKDIFSIIMVITIGHLQSCMAPVFSDLQSARLVGKKNVELTPSYTTVGYTEDGESDGVQNHIGAQLAVGLSDNVDLRFRFEHLWEKEYADNNEQVIGLGPKIGLVKDRIAAYLPVGAALSDISTFQFHPTLLFTLPVVHDQIDFNPSAKYLISFCEDCDNFLAFNLGIALSQDLSKWAFRAEYGFLINPGESGSYRQFTFGFSFPLNKRTKP